MKQAVLYLTLALCFITAQASDLDCLEERLASESHFARTVFSEINTGITVKSLSNIYTYLREMTDSKLIKNVEARRLVNPEDWKKASRQFKSDAWRAYGDQTINDWFKGREYVLDLPKNRKIDSSLLKKIHKIVSENHKFHGFEGRRIKLRYDRGEISEDQFKELLRRAYKDNEEVSGVAHSSLTGQFRKEKVDQVIHRGSHFAKDGSRYFTKSELEELRKNKYITVDEKSIKTTGKDSYTGIARYEDVEKVEKAIDDILKNVEVKLKKAKSLRQIVKIVVLMEKDLISVHPFLDGNGRSIRLLGDYVLSRYNLPPSLYPNESDLTMPLSEAVDFHIEGMGDYLKVHQRHIRSLLPSS